MLSGFGGLAGSIRRSIHLKTPGGAGVPARANIIQKNDRSIGRICRGFHTASILAEPRSQPQPNQHLKTPLSRDFAEVEPAGIEPATSCLQRGGGT
jgi:hypothetical protein